MFYEYNYYNVYACVQVNLKIKGNHQDQKNAKVDQEDGLDQEAMKEDQSIRKDTNTEIDHTVRKDPEVDREDGLDQKAMKEDQSIRKDTNTEIDHTVRKDPEVEEDQVVEKH